MPLTFPILSVADSTAILARHRPTFLTPRSSPSFCADADTEFIRKFHLNRRRAFVAPGY
jgi:hypothetical protein